MARALGFFRALAKTRASLSDLWSSALSWLHSAAHAYICVSRVFRIPRSCRHIGHWRCHRACIVLSALDCECVCGLRGSSLQSPHIRALLCLRLNRRFIKFKFPFNCHPEHKRPAQWTTNDTRYLTVDMMPQPRTSSSTRQLADQADGVKKKTGWSRYVFVQTSRKYEIVNP